MGLNPVGIDRRQILIELQILAAPQTLQKIYAVGEVYVAAGAVAGEEIILLHPTKEGNFRVLGEGQRPVFQQDSPLCGGLPQKGGHNRIDLFLGIVMQLRLAHQAGQPQSGIQNHLFQSHSILLFFWLFFLILASGTEEVNTRKRRTGKTPVRQLLFFFIQLLPLLFRQTHEKLQGPEAQQSGQHTGDAGSQPVSLREALEQGHGHRSDNR